MRGDVSAEPAAIGFSLGGVLHGGAPTHRWWPRCVASSCPAPSRADWPTGPIYSQTAVRPPADGGAATARVVPRWLSSLVPAPKRGRWPTGANLPPTRLPPAGGRRGRA